MGLDEAVKCPAREPMHLLQCPAAQFGLVGRRFLAAAIRSTQSGMASVTGTIVAFPVRMASSSS